MKLIKYICTMVLIGLSTSVFAQDNILSFNYNIATPLGNTSSFIENTAYDGFGVEYRHFVKDKISVGIDLSWSSFYQDVPGYSYYDIEGAEGKNITVGGKEFRYAETRPIMLTSHYYLGEKGKIRPFVGLGIGVNFVNLTQEIGSLTFYDDKCLFAMRPEVGLYVPVSRSIGFLTSAKYNYAVGAGSMDTQSYMSFNFGLAFSL